VLCEGRPVTISVVVVTLGRSLVFERCLAAVEGGVRNPDELVVVDQSVDGLAHLLERSRVPVRHVRATDLGISRARNLGAEAASGDTLAFTDDDCVPDTEWLAELASVDGEVATGRILPLDDERKGLVAVSSRTSTDYRRFRGAAENVPWDTGSGGNLLVARELFERLGGFDVRFGPGARYRAAEDVEFLERVLRAGATIAYTPAAVVYHERKRRAGRLKRRVPYGFGMGAAVAAGGGGRRRFLASRYLVMQLRAAGSGAKALSPVRVVEPLLSTVGFAAGIALYRQPELVPKDTVRSP
jgi:O-antigen biosynthesis protein